MLSWFLGIKFDPILIFFSNLLLVIFMIFLFDIWLDISMIF